jgi:hypothetical protein
MVLERACDHDDGSGRSPAKAHIYTFPDARRHGYLVTVSNVVMLSQIWRDNRETVLREALILR